MAKKYTLSEIAANPDLKKQIIQFEYLPSNVPAADTILIAEFLKNNTTIKEIISSNFGNNQKLFSTIIELVKSRATSLEKIVFDTSKVQDGMKQQILDFIFSPQSIFCKISVDYIFYLPKGENLKTIKARLANSFKDLANWAKSESISKAELDKYIKNLQTFYAEVQWRGDDQNEISSAILDHAYKICGLINSLPEVADQPPSYFASARNFEIGNGLDLVEQLGYSECPSDKGGDANL